MRFNSRGEFHGGRTGIGDYLTDDQWVTQEELGSAWLAAGGNKWADTTQVARSNFDYSYAPGLVSKVWDIADDGTVCEVSNYHVPYQVGVWPNRELYLQTDQPVMFARAVTGGHFCARVGYSKIYCSTHGWVYVPAGCQAFDLAQVGHVLLYTTHKHLVLVNLTTGLGRRVMESRYYPDLYAAAGGVYVGYGTDPVDAHPQVLFVPYDSLTEELADLSDADVPPPIDPPDPEEPPPVDPDEPDPEEPETPIEKPERPPDPPPLPSAFPTAFQTANGHYWCAEGGGGSDVHTMRDAVGPWETFTVTRLGGSQITLTTADGHFVTADDTGRMLADRTHQDIWETFTLERHGGQVALRSFHGKYVCAEEGGGGVLVANRDAVGPWESFAASIPRGPGAGPTPIPPAPGLVDPFNGRVSINGRLFWNAGGLFRPVFTSGLAILSRTAGEQTAFLDWTVATGFNGLRLFAGHLGWCGQTAASAVAALPGCLDAAQARGLYVEVTAITDSEEGYNTEEHYRQVAEICNRYDHTILEVANEPYHATQSEDVHDPGYLLSLGSRYSGDVLYALGAADDDESQEMAGGQFVTAHLSRSRDRWNMVRRVRELENVSNQAGKPVMNNEPAGADETESGSRLSDPAIFHCMGALNRIFEVGGVHHSTHGLHAILPGPVQQACASAFLTGFTCIPTREALVFKNASWGDSPVKGANFDGGGVFRVYSGLWSGGQGVTCLVGEDAHNSGVEWQHGWHPTGTLSESQSNVDGRWCRVLKIEA